MDSSTPSPSSKINHDLPHTTHEQISSGSAPSVRHEIFDPISKTSHSSHAPSDGPGISYKQSVYSVRCGSGLTSSLMWWLPEILALIVAVGCLVVTFLILWLYDGQPISQVNIPGSLTLNGIIAAFSTIARVAVLVPVSSALSQESWIWFSSNAHQGNECRSRLLDLDLSDNASRGAWGSLLFLMFSPKRGIAYVGALVTIMTLAFGTSTQQLVTIAQFDVPSSNQRLVPGNLPRAETWQYYNAIPTQNILTLPFDIRAAVYSGILAGKTDPIIANCPTGNCTWPVTSSLAICGECTASDYTRVCGSTVCNYTMPSGSNTLLANGGDEGFGFAVLSNPHGSIYNGTSGDRIYLVHFDVVGVPYGTLGPDYQTANKTASECALWMCVQSYETFMANGQLLQKTTMEFSTLTAPAISLQGAFNNFTFADLPAEMNSKPDITYNVSHIGLASFSTSMYGLFNGTGFIDSRSSGVALTTTLGAMDTTDAVWNASTNLNPWIKNVAASITNALRYDNPNPNPPALQSLQPAPRRSIYDGKAFVLGVKVQWWWFTLPVLCVALSILFLVVIMIKTAGSPVAPWKSSLLTFLFFGVDHDVAKQVEGKMNDLREVTKAIGNAKVFLKEDHRGKWTFQAV